MLTKNQLPKVILVFIVGIVVLIFLVSQEQTARTKVYPVVEVSPSPVGPKVVDDEEQLKKFEIQPEEKIFIDVEKDLNNL